MDTTPTPDTENLNEQAPDTQPAEGTAAHKSKPKKKDAEQIRQLEEALEKAQKELEDTKSIYQRMLAEYANYKRRTEQEKEQLGQFTKAETLKALLPAFDNFMRAAQAPFGEEYKRGIDMTVQQTEDLLKAQGLEVIDPLNAPFEPEWHHAVMREDADGVEPDTVTEVYQKGYRLGGRLIRPAMVKVAN